MGVRPRLKPRLRVWMRAGEVGGERVWVARAPPPRQRRARSARACSAHTALHVVRALWVGAGVRT